jgi:hypothetical protein
MKNLAPVLAGLFLWPGAVATNRPGAPLMQRLAGRLWGAVQQPLRRPSLLTSLTSPLTRSCVMRLQRGGESSSRLAHVALRRPSR